MNEIISIQIPKEIDASFEILAKETHTPKIFHFEKALKNYLNQLNKLSFKSDDKPEQELDKIDVSVQTKHIHRDRLQRAKSANEKKKSLNSPFLSSSPVDLGYTDFSLIDKIIIGDD